MVKVLVHGPQGSGKGTQAAILANKLNVPALSMGQLLRDRVAAADAFGRKLGAILERGELVSDEDALNVLRERIEQPDAAEGYVLDGYPRNMAQFAPSEEFVRPTHVIVLVVPREVSVERLRVRAVKERRDDDTPEALNRRLEIYEQETKPMLEEYRKRGIVYDVDGVGTVEEVAGRIWQVFGV